MPDAPYIRYPDGSVSHGETLRADELPSLGLDGKDMTFIRIDHQTRLQFDETEIVIETPFMLSEGGTELQLDPARRADLGPLLSLYPGVLASAAVGETLTLSLFFASGATVNVPQHPRYESWHVMGPGTRWIVCPPAGNGTLSVWR